MLIRDGFPGQRFRVLPSDVIDAACVTGPTARLLVTDAGYFPHAHHHGRTRRQGSRGAVVILCVDGAGYCRSEDGPVTVRTGQALVIPAGVPHVYWADRDDPWTIWWLHVYGPDATTFEQALRRTVRSALPVIDVHDMFRAVGEVERAVEFLETDETPPNLIRASGAAWSLMAELSADAAAGNPSRGEPVRQAQEYLRTRLDAPVSVAALARTAGLSVSHFCALFRAATGGGVVEYSKRLRMSRACELLITTSMSVTQIARAVGYEDPLYFSRQFRSVHATSPTQFRRNGGTA